jgi:hypothetical protein
LKLTEVRFIDLQGTNAGRAGLFPMQALIRGVRDMALLREDVISVLGPVDETIVAEIVATGATPEELAQAWAWVNSDDALIDEGRPLPSGRVQELVDILAPEPEDEFAGR